MTRISAIRPVKPPRYARQTADQRRRMLVDAAIHCLAEGGIAAFTIGNISRQADVSRGLINHHFKGIEDLLAAVYEAMTASMMAAGHAAQRTDGSAEQRLATVIGLMFEPPLFSKASLKAWLALWGEAAMNPKLKATHRRSYESYRRALAGAIGEIAKERKLPVDAQRLATTTIALIDGLWIQWCLDSAVVTRDFACEAVFGILETKLGPLQR